LSSASAGIEHDELGQQARHEPREGRAQRLAGPVAGRDDLDRLVAPERRGQRARQLVDEAAHRLVERDVPGRPADRLLARVVAQRPQRSRRVDHRGRADLGEVVIVRGHPEHGHHRPAALRLELPGDRHGAERLPEHEERTAEEARLLPVTIAAAPGSASRRALAAARRASGLLLAGQAWATAFDPRRRRRGAEAIASSSKPPGPKERSDLRPPAR
jgi:hypothetical protein